MRTERGLERLIFFSDAVVAIAMTLLVLPVVDLATDAARDTPASTVLREHWQRLGAFALSFVVIAGLWRVHHRIFEAVAAYDERLVTYNLLWLFTVVFLPFPTELLASQDTNRVTAGLYIGTLLASSVALSLLETRVRHRPELQAVGWSSAHWDIPWLTTVLLAVALVLAVTIPGVGMWSLLLLLTGTPIRAAMKRRTAPQPPAADR